MRVLKNSIGLYGIEYKNNSVACCLGQDIKDLSLDRFKIYGIANTIKAKNASEVNLGFDLSNIEEISTRIEEIFKIRDYIFWNSSLDYVNSVVYGYKTAILDDMLDEDLIQYLSKDKPLKKVSKAYELILKYIDRDFLKNLTLDGNFQDSITKLFNGNQPTQGQHIVTYGFNYSENSDNFSKNDKYKLLEERHAIVLNREEVITSSKIAGTFSRTGVTKEALESFLLFYDAENNKTCYRKAYIYEDNFETINKNKQTEKLNFINEYIKNPHQPLLFNSETETECNYQNNKKNNEDNVIENLKRINNFNFSLILGYILAESSRTEEEIFSRYYKRKEQVAIRNQYSRLQEAITYAELKTGKKFGLKFLADSLGMSRQTIYNWTHALNVKKTIPLNKLMEICGLLGVVTPHWVYYGAEFPRDIPLSPEEKESFRDKLEVFRLSKSNVGLSGNSYLYKQFDSIEVLNACNNQLKRQLGISLTSKDKTVKENRENNKYLFSTIIAIDELGEISFITETPPKKITLFDDNYSGHVCIHNYDEHMFPRIEKDDYIILDRNHSINEILSLVKQIQSESYYKTNEKILGTYLFQLNNLILTGKVSFNLLFNSLKIVFDNSNLEIVSTKISSESKPLMFHMYQQGQLSEQPINLKFIGKIRQVIKYL